MTNAGVRSDFAVIDLLPAVSRNTPGDPPGGVLLFREPLRQAFQSNSGTGIDRASVFVADAD